MENTFKPENQNQLLEALQWAVASASALDVRGCGSKQGLGRPAKSEHVLDMTAMQGIIDYQPGELYVKAWAGTLLSEIQTALDQESQQLNFEPPDYGPLLGGEAGQGTVGGLVACNLAGPRRIQVGSARDAFLGFNAVSGRGEIFKSGGTVFKNVTGFDLSKLITGSYGTLAVMTEVALKALPKADKTRTVLLRWAKDGVHDHGGIRAMAEAMQSTNEVSAAAHLPAKVAVRSSVDYISSAGCDVTAVRIEGPTPSVEYRCNALRDLLAAHGEIEELHGRNSARFWKEVADVSFFAEDPSRPLWRLSVPPAKGADVAMELLSYAHGEVFYDWAGGLIWFQTEEANNASNAHVRACVDAVGGHATLFRASAKIKTSVEVFHPQPKALAKVSARVKAGFDPGGILNPGRMYEGV